MDNSFTFILDVTSIIPQQHRQINNTKTSHNSYRPLTVYHSYTIHSLDSHSHTALSHTRQWHCTLTH